jgi:hypothetical protein
MDQEHLKKYFPLSNYQEPDVVTAQNAIREKTHALASSINKYLVEGQAKNEMLMRLLHLAKDVELALQLDGPSRTINLVVTN